MTQVQSAEIRRLPEVLFASFKTPSPSEMSDHPLPLLTAITIRTSLDFGKNTTIPNPPARNMSERDKGKRPASITSSAFSFSLGTPSKKTRVGPPNQARTTTTPQPSRLNGLKPGAHHDLMTTPLRAAPILKFAQKEGAQPVDTPNSAHAKRVSSLAPPITPSRPQAPTGEMGAIPSPFSLHRPSPRHNEPSMPVAGPSRRLNAVLGDSTYTRKDDREKHGITSIPKLSADIVKPQETTGEEGIGVSPRRNKTIQHKGPGPPPSVRLNNLISSANTSLVLFYTALQHTIYRNKTPSLQHIQSSPLHLAIIGTPILSHSAIMAECQSPGSERCLVVFQTLPQDCPRVGVDPRVVGHSEKPYEVGIWGPYSEVELPDGRKAVFAARYLIAEKRNG